MNGSDHLEQKEGSIGGLLVSMFFMGCLGFSAHRMRPVIQAKGPVWSELISYVVGGLLILAVFPVMFTQVAIGMSRRIALLGTVSLILSYVAVGSGVALGWVVDPDIGGGPNGRR